MKILARDVRTNMLSNGDVNLSFGANIAVIQELLNLSGDLEITLEKPHRKKTLLQNNYLWALLGEISIKENGTRADDEIIYTNILKACGAKIDYFQTIPETVESLKRFYRVVEIVENRGKTVMCKCYPGTSTMNTEEMSLVIDKTLEYAAEIGLDTDYWKGKLYD